MESTKGKQPATGPPEGEQPAKRPVHEPHPLLVKMRSGDDKVVAEGFSAAFVELTAEKPLHGVTLRDSVTAAVEFFKKVESIEPLNTDQEVASLKAVKFVGKAAVLGNVSSPAMQAAAAPAVVAVCRAAGISPEERRELSSQAVLLLGGLLCRVPSVFDQPIMVRKMGAQLAHSDERICGVALSLLATVCKSVLEVPDLKGDEAVKAVAGGLLKFLLQHYPQLRAARGFEVQAALLSPNTQACQMAAFYILQAAGVQPSVTGTIDKKSMVKEVVIKFEAFAPQQPSAEMSAAEASNVVIKKAGGVDALLAKMTTAADEHDELLKSYGSWYTTMKSHPVLQLPQYEPIRRMAGMLWKLSNEMAKMVIPAEDAPLLFMLVEMIQQLLAKSDEFCRKQADVVVKCLESSNPNITTLSAGMSAVLMCTLDVMPAATITLRIYTRELPGVLLIGCTSLRRMGDVCELMPLDLFNAVRPRVTGMPSSPAQLAQFVCPARVAGSDAAVGEGNLLIVGGKSLREMAAASQDAKLRELATLTSDTELFYTICDLEKVPTDSYQYLVMERRDFYSSCGMAEEFNVAVCSVPNASSTGEALRYVQRGVMRPPALRTVGDVARGLNLLSPMSPIMRSKPTLNWMLGPQGFVREGELNCNLQLNGRMVGGEERREVEERRGVFDSLYNKYLQAAIEAGVCTAHGAGDSGAITGEGEESVIAPFDVADAVYYKGKGKEDTPSASKLAGQLVAACQDALRASPAAAAEAISKLIASARKLGPMHGPAL